MSKITVWDIPIRIFHWAFTICLTLALMISFLFDDDSSLFQYHMLFGLAAGFLLVIRLVIGVFGARYSRLSGLFFSPLETLHYIKGTIFGGAPRYIGHNPGTAFVALVMFILVGGLIWTGLWMASDFSEDAHELLAYGMIAMIVAHLLGLLLHTIRHRENIAISIITGKKEGDNDAKLKSPQLIAGIFTLLIFALWTGFLFRSYDPAASTVTIPGLGQVSLGDSDDESNDDEGNKAYENEDDD